MVNVTMPADPLTVPGSTAADVELTDLGQTNAEVAYTNKPRTNWSGILLSVWAGISILGTFVWYVGVAPYFNMLCSQSNCTSIANATSIAIATYMTSNYTVTSRYPALTDTYATTTHATPTITTITFVTTVRATAISATESAALHRAAVWAAPTDVPTKKLDGQSTSWRGAVNYFLILYNVLTFLALCLIALHRYKKKRAARAATEATWPGREIRDRVRQLRDEDQNEIIADNLRRAGLL